MINSKKRWYEKDEHLGAFFALIEELPDDIQCEIAVDILMKTSELLDRKYENIIADVADYNPKDYNRWYDKNPNIHVAIESIKDLEEDKRDEIVKELSDLILKYYPEAQI